MRILAVDDDPQFLELLEATLASLSYADVTLAQSAGHALEIIKSANRPFDCILLDIQMPEIDGIQLCHMIRQFVVYRSTPILMITALTQKHCVDAAFEVGATDYINKPIEAGEMRARLGNIAAYLKRIRENANLKFQLREVHKQAPTSLAFDDPESIGEVDGLINYMALENYLLKLGKMRSYLYGAVGWRVDNAQLLHANTDAQDFIYIMAEVGIAIRDTMRSKLSFLSYAGAGGFVSIVPKTISVSEDDVKEVEAHLELGLAPMFSDPGQIPRIRAGSTVQQSFMSARRPTKILLHALDAVHRKRTDPVFPRFLSKAV